MNEDEHTANCIVCGKPATRWAGHVHLGSLVFTAGWCSGACVDKSKGKACADFSAGCHGDWKLGDGKRGPTQPREPTLEERLLKRITDIEARLAKLERERNGQEKNL